MEKSTKRYAVVTGSNKGIGFGTVRPLASKGITVVLTARDEKRGLEAVEKLKESGLSGQVVFHQLDVADPASIAPLAQFIETQFRKLDILVSSKLVSLKVSVLWNQLSDLKTPNKMKIFIWGDGGICDSPYVVP